MGTNAPDDVEKLILGMTNENRESKKFKEIKKDFKFIDEYTKTRLSQLNQKEKRSDDEEKEKKLLENKSPYKSYLRLLREDEIKAFCGIDVIEADKDHPEMQIGNYNLILEEPNLRPDKAYFWMLDFITNKFHLGYENVIKTEDSVVFGAMSQYGNQFNQVRGGKQQVAQAYLKTISEVMRSLFPLLYEIKQSDELLSIYQAAKLMENYKTLEELNDPKNRTAVENAFSAERTLRDKWAAEVDGGKLFAYSKPQSQQGPGYVLLPHWFFSVKVRNPKNADSATGKESENWPFVIQEAIKVLVDNKSINYEVSNVLGNFLLRFKIWQRESFKQLDNARKFKISYLRQQYANIRLYIDWLKPMLKVIQEMAPKVGKHSKYSIGSDSDINRPEKNPNIYNALDTNQMFLEFLAYKKPDEKKNEKYYQVITVSITHRTTSLTFDIGGQNQNLPFGSNDIKIRGFVWTREQFDVYLRKKEDQEFDILESLYDSMKEVREQIERYLKEDIDMTYADKLLREHPDYYPEKTAKAFKSLKNNVFALSSLLGPFSHLLAGFSSAFNPMLDIFKFNPGAKKDEDLQEFRYSKDLYNKKEKLNSHVFTVYDVYKRANKLTVW